MREQKQSLEYDLFDNDRIGTYRSFAIESALYAGREIQKKRREIEEGEQGATYGRELKFDRTPVSALDRKINSWVIEQVHDKFPDHDVYGEEEDDFSRESDFRWIVDPIDGTNNFVRGLSAVGYSLALTYQGMPIVGVLAIPLMRGELYVADYRSRTLRLRDMWRGPPDTEQGERRQGDPLLYGTRTEQSVSKEDRRGYTIVGVRHIPKTRTDLDLTGIVERLHSKGIETCDLASTSVMGAKLASGRLDGLIFSGRGGHDMAAIDLIVRQAGGIVSAPDGAKQRYDGRIRGAVAANSAFYPKLMDILRDGNGVFRKVSGE